MDSQNTGKKVSLPNKKISIAELAVSLDVLAKQFNTTLSSIIRKLDRVSGNLQHLKLSLNGDNRFEWTQEEDQLLQTNEGLLIRWKGKQAVQLRKKYLNWKEKKQ